ncbi:MAG: right-handed parallel beta-helix repeat-containing protein [Aggregatilineales bacterium]
MSKSRIMVILAVLTLSVLTFTAQIQPAHAANCDGLQLTGTIPAGTYTLTDNCITTGTLTVTAGTVTINGAGFAVDGNNTHRVFNVSTGANLNLNNITVSNGNTTGFGGGVSNSGTLTVTNSIIYSNSAVTGGGVYNQGIIATISNSTVSGNSSTNGGGAISNYGTMTITNTTVSSNTAGADGGSIFNTATVTIRNSTLSGNASSGADEIVIANGNGTLINTIVTGACINNSVLNDGGGNIAFNAAGCPGANTNPILGAFNGSYYPLLAGSPAIDGAPTCAGLTNDQIGTTRPQGVACDIGAIEMPQTVVTNPTTGQPTFELVPIVIPAVPSLNEWNATASESRAEAYGVDENVYATIHMQNGAWQYNSGGIPQDLLDYGVILAIDVWELGGDQFFDHYEKVCLHGEGRLIFFDATTSPRQMTEILPVTFEDGYTCGWIPNAGTLVLIDPE